MARLCPQSCNLVFKHLRPFCYNKTFAVNMAATWQEENDRTTTKLGRTDQTIAVHPRNDAASTNLIPLVSAS